MTTQIQGSHAAKPVKSPSETVDKSSDRYEKGPVRDQVFDKLLNAFRKMNDPKLFIGDPGSGAHREILNLPQIFEEIVQKVTEVVDSSIGRTEKLELVLFPKELGQINVEITLVGNKLVDISFMLETEIKKIFKNNIYKLDHNLAVSGIKSNITIREKESAGFTGK
ncbi:hypothetical protein ACFL57_02255 [Candidatus Margulisiibacteriota bacterium]